jgi:hypothetical protein
MSGNLAYNLQTSLVSYRVHLHATNQRHGANSFTSFPKEGMLRIFSSKKIQQLRPGANLRSWVPEASMLTTRPTKPLGGWVCVLVNQSYCYLAWYLCVGVCVNRSVLVLCGYDVWFFAGVICVLYFVYLRFWYVNPLGQVLAGTPLPF